MHPQLDSRPILVALAGPNGAGKSTFYEAHLRSSGLRFVNADDLGRELNLDAREAARLANALRVELVRDKESFIFETVFSDPKRDKLNFLKDAAAGGYTVVVVFIGLSSAAASEERVAMRVTQGGHDVPTGKVMARYSRTLTNLAAAMAELPLVLVYDNSSFEFRRVAEFQDGRLIFCAANVPDWFKPLLKPYQ